MNRSESKTVRMFRPVRQMAAPGAKYAVFDCMFLKWSKRKKVLLSSEGSDRDGFPIPWIRPW